MIVNLVTKAEMYYEEYYWSFFQDSGHQHHGRGVNIEDLMQVYHQH